MGHRILHVAHEKSPARERLPCAGLMNWFLQSAIATENQLTFWRNSHLLFLRSVKNSFRRSLLQTAIMGPTVGNLTGRGVAAPRATVGERFSGLGAIALQCQLETPRRITDFGGDILH